MSGPDRIWAFYSDVFGAMWTPYIDDGATEYIRRDPAVLAALPEVQAIVDSAVKAEREACAKIADETYAHAVCEFPDQTQCAIGIAVAIRNRGEGQP